MSGLEIGKFKIGNSTIIIILAAGMMFYLLWTNQLRPIELWTDFWRWALSPHK